MKDLFLKSAGARRGKPREVNVEMLVDTGATRLYLKPSVIKRLGLQRVDAVRSQTTNGEAIRFKYEPVHVIQGRAPSPNLLGKAPLALLDLVVDSKSQKLIPNPAHGGEQMTEEY